MDDWPWHASGRRVIHFMVQSDADGKRQPERSLAYDGYRVNGRCMLPNRSVRTKAVNFSSSSAFANLMCGEFSLSVSEQTVI